MEMTFPVAARGSHKHREYNTRHTSVWRRSLTAAAPFSAGPTVCLWSRYHSHCQWLCSWAGPGCDDAEFYFFVLLTYVHAARIIPLSHSMSSPAVLQQPRRSRCDPLGRPLAGNTRKSKCTHLRWTDEMLMSSERMCVDWKRRVCNRSHSIWAELDFSNLQSAMLCEQLGKLVWI